jgi:hypothetical protein
MYLYLCVILMENGRGVRCVLMCIYFIRRCGKYNSWILYKVCYSLTWYFCIFFRIESKEAYHLVASRVVSY